MPFFQNDKIKRSAAAPPHIVSISTWTIFKIVLVLGLIAFAWVVREVLGILFVSWILASALDPTVDHFARYRVPRAITIFVILLLMILVVGLAVYLIIPPMTKQIEDIAASLNEYTPFFSQLYQSFTGISQGGILPEIQQNIASLNSALSNLTSGLFRAVSDVFGGLVSILVVFMITFYMTVDEDSMKKFIRSVAPIQYQPYLVQKVNRIQEKMGSWLRGQLILMLIIGVLSFIGLASLRVPYALVLAFLSGLLEFVPFLGPVLAAIPAIFFAYTDSPAKAVGVVIMYTVIQQLENQVIVPKVMQKAVGLNPIIIITVMLVGGYVAGLVGVILAVPAATIVWIFLEDVYLHKQEQENRLEKPFGDEHP